ncbi:hypothetical protein ACQPYK_30200 [Streptosporangium sp. CA-135522]|uniref:hypothetical protein n=1 Tax=Streptosporangium sp. CA-135522 TaxID=3240072 RepID=UPI003D8BAC79
MDDATRSVRVGRDVRGQLVVGDHNVTVTAERSIITVIQGTERPKPRRYDRIRLLPRRADAPVGREEELSALALAAASGRAVQVHGRQGSGKSVLLRHAARDIADAGGDMVFLNGHGRDVEDIVQDAFEACYETSGFRPSNGELRRLMAGVNVCLAVDDLDCPGDELATLLDAVPDGAVLMTSAERSMWGHGDVIPLGGLGPRESLELVATAVGRSLLPAEEAAANLLREATGGHPLDLVRAVAAARPVEDGGLSLPHPSEVPEILARLLESLDGPGREIVTLLATADGATVSTALIALLREGDGEIEPLVAHLARIGLLIESDHGHRLAAGIAGALPAEFGTAPDRLAALGERLILWTASKGVSPLEVADHEAFITGLVGALSHAGRPELGSRLARAAAPATACSLRWGAWRRLLGSGLGAARLAGDEPAQAYFNHENGIRALLTGKRVVAIASLGAAIAIWKRLGDTQAVEAAQHAQTLGTSPVPSAPPGDTGATASTQAGPSAPHTDVTANADATGHAQTAGRPDPTAAKSSSHGSTDAAEKTGTGQDTGTWQGTGDTAVSGAKVKTGMSLTAKIIVGAALGGGLVAGGGVILGRLTESGTVPVHVKVSTRLVNVTMPGSPEGNCQAAGKGTNCTWLVNSRRGAVGPIEVRPDQPLPDKVAFRYWGCTEGPGASSCTVRADREQTVCVTTTSAKDKAARKACAAVQAQVQAPSTPAAPMTKFGIVAATRWRLKITGQPEGCVFPTPTNKPGELPEPSSCFFDTPIGGSFTLTAEVVGEDPWPQFGNLKRDKTLVWYGCDEGPASPTCTVTVTQERVDETRKSAAGELPSVRLVACVATKDIAEGTLQSVCANLTGSKRPDEPPPP